MPTHVQACHVLALQQAGAKCRQIHQASKSWLGSLCKHVVLIMSHASQVHDDHGMHAAMVTIIYHKKLTAEWKIAAEELRSLLTSAPSSSGVVQVIGRSRKQKIELFTSHVDEVMTVAGKHLHYRQVEGAFSQPNGGDNLVLSSCSPSTSCCVSSWVFLLPVLQWTASCARACLYEVSWADSSIM